MHEVSVVCVYVCENMCECIYVSTHAHWSLPACMSVRIPDSLDLKLQTVVSCCVLGIEPQSPESFVDF